MTTMSSAQTVTAAPNTPQSAELPPGANQTAAPCRAGVRRSGRWFPILHLACALFVAALARPVAANEFRTTLTLKADASCVIRSDSAQPRLPLEQQLRLEERKKNMSESDDEGEGTPTPPPAEKDPKPYTDSEMEKKVREMVEAQQEHRVLAGETKIESIAVTSNSVRTVTMQAFASLEELLRNPYALWGQSGLNFESLRFEKNADGRLRITITPHSGNPRWTKGAKQMWKVSRVSAELRFVLPGQVLTSGLPNTDGNATWIAFDAKKDETLDAAAKLYDAPTVITAELGGLKIDAPLDSRTLSRQPSRQSGGDSELPITDAGPGFAAEPLSVTVTTLQWFPGGQKILKNASTAFGRQPTGAVVQAKLFAPKGRTFQSVSEVRVLKAVDDKGRPIATAKADENAAGSVAYSSGGGRGPVTSMQLQLRLPLPAPDAQSIEQLDAEAIAVTAGNWKEMTVPSVTATSTNEVDLASVLPGAKLVITKLTTKNRQTMIQAQLKGPPAIRQVEIQAKMGSQRNANSWLNERGFKAKGAESTRNFSLQAHGMTDEGEALSGALSIVVRYPEDQRRERVKFSLKGLDLL